MDLTPVTLRGRPLPLEPVEERQAPDLFETMHTVPASILDTEWPAVKARLEAKLGVPG